VAPSTQEKLGFDNAHVLDFLKKFEAKEGIQGCLAAALVDWMLEVSRQWSTVWGQENVKTFLRVCEIVMECIAPPEMARRADFGDIAQVCLPVERRFDL
jgi:hypothetical protein